MPLLEVQVTTGTGKEAQDDAGTGEFPATLASMPGSVSLGPSLMNFPAPTLPFASLLGPIQCGSGPSGDSSDLPTLGPVLTCASTLQGERTTPCLTLARGSEAEQGAMCVSPSKAD